MSKSVILTRDLPFPPDRVWRAIATGALMAEWLLPNDFQPIPGHGFTLRSPTAPGWDGVIEAEVLAVDPPGRLAYSWVALGVVTEVNFMLEPTATGTRLTMEHSGFRADQAQNYAGARHGWTMFLNRLDTLLTKES
jgi:uncharacterized protein YndB with AHSA1/START domain